MYYTDELKKRELTSRMGGKSTQTRFISLVWSEEFHVIISSRLPEIMDNLDEMPPERLTALVNVLDTEACRANPKVSATALAMVLTNASDGKLYRWAEIMEHHYERFIEDELFAHLDSSSVMTVISTMIRYDKAVLMPLTSEQEWSLLTVTALGMDGSNPAVKGELSGKGRWVRNVELVRYIAHNHHRVLEIVEVMTELKVLRPVEIDAHLAGERSVMMEGML